MANNPRRRTTGYSGNVRRLTIEEQQTRLLRAKKLSRAIFRCLSVAGLVVLGYFLCQFVFDWMKESDIFKIKNIVISGNLHLSEDDIKQRTGLEINKFFYEFDQKQISDTLVTDPWVERVLVNRIVPDTIMVTIYERTPKAIISLERLYLLDEANQPFVEAPLDMIGQLPFITGIDRQFLTEHKAQADDVLAWGQEAYNLFVQEERFADNKKLKITEVNVSPITGVEMELNRGIRLVLGFNGSGEDSYKSKIQRVYQTINTIENRGLQARTIYLDNKQFPQRVYVSLAKKS